MTQIEQLAHEGHQQICDWISEIKITQKNFGKGEHLLCQGQKIDPLYWVESDVCTINYTASHGRRYSHGRFEIEKRLFGEIEFLTNSPSQFDVCADQPMTARLIPVADLTLFLADNPKVSIWLSHCLSHTYQQLIQQVTSHFMYPLAYNIAKDLLERNQGDKPAIQFSQAYREAERFSCSERVYRRAVSQLVEEGILLRDKRQLVISDVLKLKNYVNNMDS